MIDFLINLCKMIDNEEEKNKKIIHTNDKELNCMLSCLDMALKRVNDVYISDQISSLKNKLEEIYFNKE